VIQDGEAPSFINNNLHRGFYSCRYELVLSATTAKHPRMQRMQRELMTSGPTRAIVGIDAAEPMYLATQTCAQYPA